MNYYNEIKKELINNEIYKKVKDYSKEKNTVITYYEIGKLLNEAGRKYGDNIIDKYSERLIVEVGKKYNKRTLFRMRQFYITFSNKKVSPLATQLTWSHYCELLPIKDKNKLLYYLKVSLQQNLTKRELREKIKNKEYERIDEETKLKFKENDYKNEISDFLKNPILIKNKNNYQSISEKALKYLILEDIPAFMKELGEGFSFIDSEYKIKLGNSYNYIDLLLFNYKYNCFVVVELKITKLMKEHIGQIQTYMKYIDKNIRSLTQDKTIGIIIVRKENKFIMEYSSDERIYETEYKLI
ncbi:MAG: DUF1016 domain-containing protein [Firmicutes bacterium]|nr:DUF1016 domain-containing protein [Bacillota bacterium]